MNNPKYISKQVTRISEFVTVSKYFYTWGVSVYISDSRREGSIQVNIHLVELERALKTRQPA